ncbi:FAD-binding protein [Streptomyces solincola]|uniref:FAD-binding protein n=1 Tax=Streptomyces solincola TaxID=2100817 RepID=A0A2S9Q182_9ACTN|nr:D-arabinono-1,4-lactone oxidase [Streptomyces solincola]PRH80367.1 FAD-binding protein [Streptomyces solincola]
MTTNATNWSGTVRFGARQVHQPTSVAQLQEIVAGATRVRALGTGHSFSPVADTRGDMVRLDALPERCDVSADGTRARVSAALTYGELAPRLHRSGRALPNLGSLPHICVAGACATGTHGSGNRCRCIAAGVRSLIAVTPDGTPVTFDRGDAAFGGAVVSLGSLGIVTELTLDLVPAFDVEQYVFEEVPWEVLVERLGQVMACAYSVSAFTTPGGPADLWVKRRVQDDPPDLGGTGARPATAQRHPVAAMSAVNCTPQLGEPGPWHERLPHFRAEFTPATGHEIQSEYLVAAADGPKALEALVPLRDRLAPLLQIVEIRTVAADDCWLSPAYHRDSVALHFTWLPDPEGVAGLVPRIEEALAPFAARPHWGKVFRTDPAAVADLYPRWEDYRDLLRRYDPRGKLRNPMIDRYFPPED